MDNTRRAVITLAAFCALAGGPARGEILDGELPLLKVGGFADVIFTSEPASPEDPYLLLNQAEIELSALVAPTVALVMAPSWDGEAMTLATAYVQFERHGADEYVFSRHLTGCGLVVGRFDVPFGIDWLSYPSIDRPLITPPNGVLGTHAGWNADGAMFLGCLRWINAIVHVTGGNDLVREVPAGGSEAWLGRLSGGGRLGFMPLPGLSLGGSAAHIDAADDRQRRLLGADLILRRGGLDLRAEYIDHRSQAGATRLHDDAWYVQGQWDFGPAYAIARWDVLEAATGTARSVSLGAGVPLNPWVILRGEYRAALGDDDPDAFYLQMAAGF